MAITGTAITTAGSLTFSALKQYAKDQLLDKSDTKAVRRAGRIVNQALKFLASEKRWSWYLRLWTIVLRPKTTYTDAVTMEVDSRTITLDSGAWPSNAVNRSFQFSGDTSIFRILQRTSSVALTTFSNETYVASAAASGLTGYLVYDRYELPENFNALIGAPQEKDYYKDLFYVAPEKWLNFRQSYSGNQTSPIYFTIYLNHGQQRYELLFWPTPSELREMSLWIYVNPLDMVNDADIADWDPALSYAIHAAIDLQVVKERMDTKRYPVAEKAYRDAVLRAKQHDATRIDTDPASPDLPMRGNKIQRSGALVDE